MAPPKDLKEPRRSNRRSAHSSTSASKSSGSPPPEEHLPTKDTDNHSASSTSNTGPARTKRSKDDSDENHAPQPPAHRRTTSVTSMSAAHGASSSGSGSTAKRAKRRAKEPAPPEGAVEDIMDAEDAADIVGDAGEDEEEESGETRCVCEDSDAAGFMIQCEMCKAWQHGPCMGFASEHDIPQGDYYCEQCKPEDHAELLSLLKRAQRRQQRQGSEKSHHASHVSRNSRSHSPSHLLKPPKRRNTMNSRDAAYEESLKELLDSTAVEAGAPTNVEDKDVRGSTVAPDEGAEDYTDVIPSGRKKRKRTDDEQAPTKRKRSASSASERVMPPSVVVEPRGESVGAAGSNDIASLLPPPAPTGKSRVRRGGGGRKSAAATVAVDTSVNGDADETASNLSKKHPNQYTYRKATSQSQPRRPPNSTVSTIVQGPTPSQASTSSAHEHGTRRNANTTAAGPSHHAQGGGSGASTRGNHHYQQHYSSTQMPMFATWGLPDYLAHLQSILPNDVPPPLVIRGASSFIRDDVAGAASSSMQNVVAENGDIDLPEHNTEAAAIASSKQADLEQLKANATGTLTERGVKAKWPAKRMSVSDMNKRVRALVEWVGREQALALDRERRRNALDTALASNLGILAFKEGEGSDPGPQPGTSKEAQSNRVKDSGEIPDGASGEDAEDADRMVVDGPLSESPVREIGECTNMSRTAAANEGNSPVDQKRCSLNLFAVNRTVERGSTTSMMEGLMAELISFQERFGPGSKSHNRERTGNRTAAVLA